jgi:hypothetical protein
MKIDNLQDYDMKFFFEIFKLKFRVRDFEIQVVNISARNTYGITVANPYIYISLNKNQRNLL